MNIFNHRIACPKNFFGIRLRLMTSRCINGAFMYEDLKTIRHGIQLVHMR